MINLDLSHDSTGAASDSRRVLASRCVRADPAVAFPGISLVF
jgi:hypothetical protein